MGTLETVLLLLLVADAIALGVLIMLQQGKGADIGAAFGSGSANTLFGSAGSASFLAKLTSWLALGFFAISFGLAYTAKERALLLRDEGMPRIQVEEAPAAPVGQAAPAEPVPLESVPVESEPAESPPAESVPSESVPAELTPPEESLDSDIPRV
jgi:preprotein translocase subunit SecG